MNNDANEILKKSLQTIFEISNRPGMFCGKPSFELFEVFVSGYLYAIDDLLKIKVSNIEEYDDTIKRLIKIKRQKLFNGNKTDDILFLLKPYIKSTELFNKILAESILSLEMDDCISIPKFIRSTSSRSNTKSPRSTVVTPRSSRSSSISTPTQFYKQSPVKIIKKSPSEYQRSITPNYELLDNSFNWRNKKF